MGILLSGAPSSFGVVVSLFVNGWFVMCGFPSREGIKGCVMVRGSVWFEMFFLGGVCLLWVDVFDFRWLCAGVTHPQPLSRGEVRVLVTCW